MQFDLYVRDTFCRNYCFEQSYLKIPNFQLSADQETLGFPFDIYRFLNFTQGQSASFFLFRQGVKPTYDDPEHAQTGGEFSFYFQLKNEFAKLDAALREMVFGLVTNTLLPANKQTPNLPFGDFTGLSIVPKQESITVKLWLSKHSLLHHKLATDVFDPSMRDAWKLQDAKYLPFYRPSAAAASSSSSASGAHHAFSRGKTTNQSHRRREKN